MAARSRGTLAARSDSDPASTGDPGQLRDAQTKACPRRSDRGTRYSQRRTADGPGRPEEKRRKEKWNEGEQRM